MKITKNPTFGQLYVEHNGYEYRVPKHNVQHFLRGIDLEEVPDEGCHHDSSLADEALELFAELVCQLPDM
ncbi:hypothetical protein N836_31520 [Leptolyngbya sp. Heron Island J]|uniref:hypothetical protein n=1 Tax=Leptolyngbya sp. Heron Island J TaxID=1385935 RepID=UPI0003B994CB|nr:hypothetical protein [Leptolyngbya sp. Heron Island J]ESA35957.1 hypothetical protein N836_09565 [Leptolyngbya sp. Heron Island J]ESA38472.1 hypothetical protein N836_31520 [Leptolyngbya sp. Heron Island J]